MKFATRLLILSTLLLSTALSIATPLRESILRTAAIEAGLVPAKETHKPYNQKYFEVGELLFESKLLSLGKTTSCSSCHLDEFGSADGLPNAVGVDGEGKGAQRMASGDIVPRNTLPFWGRGGIGYDVFFWDGKVELVEGKVASQFGTQVPSNDPLEVAVHLPPVELDEMVPDTAQHQSYKSENTNAATKVYREITQRIKADPEISLRLASAGEIEGHEIEFEHIAMALATFIRVNFSLRSTKFHRFVFENKSLTESELDGGILFYGKGRCSACHNGPYFTDFMFHSIPFPSAGFGKNGFGVDYGRFNVTLDPADKYKFRTPPLYDVINSAPYSHSGSVAKLRDAILVHTDPLAVRGIQEPSAAQRVQFYERLVAWAQSSTPKVVFTERELADLENFLGTLTIERDSD